MKKHHKKCLVLNANFIPLAITSWQSAITLIWKNKDNSTKGVQPVEYYKDDHIKGVGKNFEIPAVVRIPTYINNTKRKIAFSRKNVFIRDRCTCQYCGKQDISCATLTYDHIISRKHHKKNKNKNTPTNWTNIVTCCKSCNHFKGHRSLNDCGLLLKKQPAEPPPNQFIIGMAPWTKVPKEWMIYLTSLYKDICEVVNEN